MLSVKDLIAGLSPITSASEVDELDSSDSSDESSNLGRFFFSF